MDYVNRNLSVQGFDAGAGIFPCTVLSTEEKENDTGFLHKMNLGSLWAAFDAKNPPQLFAMESPNAVIEAAFRDRIHVSPELLDAVAKLREEGKGLDNTLLYAEDVRMPAKTFCQHFLTENKDGELSFFGGCGHIQNGDLSSPYRVSVSAAEEKWAVMQKEGRDYSDRFLREYQPEPSQKSEAMVNFEDFSKLLSPYLREVEEGRMPRKELTKGIDAAVSYLKDSLAIHGGLDLEEALQDPPLAYPLGYLKRDAKSVRDTILRSVGNKSFIDLTLMAYLTEHAAKKLIQENYIRPLAGLSKKIAFEKPKAASKGR